MGKFDDYINGTNGSNAMNNLKSVEITFDKLPMNADELRRCTGAGLDSPFYTAALTVAAMCRFCDDQNSAIEMLNYLKGPQPLSNYEISFIRDRFSGGKIYIPFSYFNGAVPQNNYVPDKPFKIIVKEDPYSYVEDGYARLTVKSSGADSARPIKLRKKGNQWFLWEQFILSDIRCPANADPWA
jgi:hypothetical protein